MGAAIVFLACVGCYQSFAETDAAEDDGGRDDAAVDYGRDESTTVDVADVADDAPITNPCPPGTVWIPTGPVVLGSDPGEGELDELLEHVAIVSDFCLDTFEVTNRGYFECVAGGGCTPPRSASSCTRAAYYGSPAFDEYPVINVDWYQAAAYCAWRGKRLPTEAEWEKAARGGCEIVAPASCGSEDERTFPWGDTAPDCEHANFVGCIGDTDRTNSLPAGASPYGTMNMAGNVQEWVADWYDMTAYVSCEHVTCVDPQGPITGSERVFRGGNWESVAASLSCANRFRQVQAYYYDTLGFRCAASLAH
jgi:formylglycine-generating enzyme required for sulfatase activity